MASCCLYACTIECVCVEWIYAVSGVNNILTDTRQHYLVNRLKVCVIVNIVNVIFVRKDEEEGVGGGEVTIVST